VALPNACNSAILKSRWTFVHLTLRTTGTRQGHKTLVASIMINMRYLILMIFFIGIGIWIYSFTLLYYTDPLIKSQIDIKYRYVNSLPVNVSDDVWKQEFYKLKEKLETNKRLFMDLGSGLAISSLTILMFFYFNNVSRPNDLNKIIFIKKTNLFILSNIAWILIIPGTFWYYSYRLGRNDYPYWADSIGVPMYQDIFIGLILFVPLNLFLWLTSKNLQFPIHVALKPIFHTTSSIFWEILFLSILIINLYFNFYYIVDGDHVFIVVNLFFTYILIVLRSGQINRQKNIAQNASH